MPIGEPVWAEVERLEDVPHHLLREIEHFFAVYKELEAKKTAVLGWRDLEEALDVLARSQRAHADQSGA